MKGKLLILLTVFMLGIVGVASAALVVHKDNIKIEGEFVKFDAEGNALETIEAERGETLTIKVKLTNDANRTGDEEIDQANVLENVVVAADILGYEFGSESLSDRTNPFDLDAGDTVFKTLKLRVPDRTDKDFYDIRLRVTQRSGPTQNFDLLLHIKGQKHKLAIRDVILSPENEVTAGRYLIVTVRVKNYGEKDEDDVKVNVAIPELGVSESDYISELEEDKSTNSEELLLRIPVNAKTGTYDVVTTVEYNEGTRAETRVDTISIVSAAGFVATEQKTVINVGVETQTLSAGSSTVYPILITNTASTAKTYTISVSGTQGWASAVVQPSNVVTVAGGETSTVSIGLTVNSGTSSGERAFVVEVKSPTKSVQIPLKAVVDEQSTSTWSRVKTGLEVALIVLVVLLVVIGLIIGFNRLKGDDDDEDKTYY